MAQESTLASIICGGSIVRSLLVMVSVLVVAGGVFAGSAFAGNIALGKPYTLVPEPNWACGGVSGDFGDYSQLTDGKYVPEEKNIWDDVRGVGWKRRGKVDIVIDLSRVEPIAAVTLSAGCGRMRAYFPNYQIAVSDDGRAFTVVRTIDNSDAARRRRRVFKADGLATAGRYVMIRLDIARGRFAFLDEIEVLKGDHDAAAVKPAGPVINPLTVDERTELQKQLSRRLDRLHERARKSPRTPQAAAAIPDYERLVDALPKARDGEQARHRRGPDPEIAEMVVSKVAELYRDVAKQMYPEPELIAWTPSPWDEVLAYEVPPPGDRVTELSVLAGGNEYESAVITLSNMSDTPRRVAVDLAGDLAGGSKWAGDVVLRAPYFKTYPGGLMLADALPRLEGPIEIPAWQTRQIWLQINTGKTPGGVYRGNVALSVDGVSRDIPLSVEVLPVRFPKHLLPATYAWHWMGSTPSILGLEAEAVKDLAAHYVNVLYIHRRIFPWPDKDQIDSEGNITGSLDFSRADKMIALCKPISGKGLNLRLYWEHTWQDLKPGTPVYRTRVQWVRRVIKHLKELGFGYDDFLLYPIDENIQTNFIRCGELIRHADPRARIFGDPMGTDWNEPAVREKADPYLDVWSPDLKHMESRRQVEVLQDKGETVWSYRVFGRTSDPYAEYRLTPWNAFRFGVTGCGFWCYARGIDSREKDLWNESPRGWAAIYTLVGAPEGVSRSEKIIPSRRWEAWREGVEDYTWLSMLRELIERRKAADTGSPNVALAADLLRRAVAEVSGNPDNSRLADEYRHAILKAITTLR